MDDRVVDRHQRRVSDCFFELGGVQRPKLGQGFRKPSFPIGLPRGEIFDGEPFRMSLVDEFVVRFAQENQVPKGLTPSSSIAESYRFPGFASRMWAIW